MTDDTTVAAGAETATTTTSAGEPWYKGADTETLGYLQNRGLDKKTAAEAAFESIKAHREATAKLGVPSDQLIRMPKDATDEAGWKALRERLGVPAKAEDYDVKDILDAGGTKDFAEFLQKTALARNLSKADGEALGRDFVKYAQQKELADAAEQEATIAAERTALDKDWGFNKTANLAIARSAAQKLGIPPEAVAALEKSAGYRVTMEALRKIGVAIGEAKFVTSETTGNVLTRDGAVARKNELMRDKDFVKKYLDGDVAANREMTNLHQLIAAQ